MRTKNKRETTMILFVYANSWQMADPILWTLSADCRYQRLRFSIWLTVVNLYIFIEKMYEPTYWKLYYLNWRTCIILLMLNGLKLDKCICWVLIFRILKLIVHSKSCEMGPSYPEIIYLFFFGQIQIDR